MARAGTANRRRKGKLAFILPWLKRFGLLLFIFIAGGGLGVWAYMSGAHLRAKDWADRKVLEMTSNMGFRLKNVMVEGRVNSDADMLLALINIEKGEPLFSFDPAVAQGLIEKINWIKSAHVERRLPDTIYIEITERRPLALWQKDKKLSLIDEEGNVITSEGLGKFKDLLIVTGDDAPQNAHELILNLQAEPVLAGRVESAQLVSGRRWDLNMKGGVSVKLPEGDVGLALRRLALAQEEDQLLDKEILNIDLREPERIVVQTKPGSAQEYKAGLKDGNNI